MLQVKRMRMTKSDALTVFRHVNEITPGIILGRRQRQIQHREEELEDERGRAGGPHERHLQASTQDDERR